MRGKPWTGVATRRGAKLPGLSLSPGVTVYQPGPSLSRARIKATRAIPLYTGARLPGWRRVLRPGSLHDSRMLTLFFVARHISYGLNHRVRFRAELSAADQARGKFAR